MVSSFWFSPFFIESAFITIGPQQEAGDPRRRPAHKLADMVQGHFRRCFDDHFIMDVPDYPAVLQRIHGICQDVPADGLHYVLCEFRPVALDPAPLLLRVGPHISDGFASEPVHADPGLYVGEPPSGRELDEEHDCLVKNPFSFELAKVVVNDSVTREAITRDQMRKFLKFVHDDNIFCKYYEAVFILFHTGMRISEFCGLTISDLDMENRVINIDHQLQRLSDMRLVIEATKTNAGTRKLPMTDEVYSCFQAILEDRPKPKIEKMVEGYSGFLYLDKAGLPLVALHWEHRMKSMVDKYNRIYRVQMPRISPHVCRHTYCSNMAKAGMNPKTLQYLMGHSDIGVTLNIYTHLGLEDAAAELKRLEDLKKAQAEMEKMEAKEKPVSKNMFRAI